TSSYLFSASVEGAGEICGRDLQRVQGNYSGTDPVMDVDESFVFKESIDVTS
ncbi:5768_t:CDS:2, partial [Dentiscutata erythropus]